MSFKFRASISRLVTNYLRRLGMLEPPAEDLPYLWFDHNRPATRQLMSVDLYKKYLSDHIDGDGKNNYAECFLYRIDHYKCSKTVEHEFLVLHFTHWGNPAATAAICVDRSVNVTIGQSSGMLTPSSSTSSENLAKDMVELIGCASNINIKSCLTEKFKTFRHISSLSFPSRSTRPSALHVAVLLFQVNQHAINYHLLDGQCYWFGHTVCKSLQTLFGQQGREDVFEPDTRGHLGPIPVFKPSKDDVNVVCDGFWDAYEQTMKVVEARRSHHLEERNKLVERTVERTRAERQHEIDERDHQINERDHRIDERDHQISERDREIAKLVEQARDDQIERDREIAKLVERARDDQIERDREIAKMQAELELLKAQFAVPKDTAESPSPSF
ncbi:hypothetical protein EV702DRAFT_1091778 [Suillus placidus]|uniref:Uncharacterized protein n=1 Tax=Suillus placidus TaxID=48579 RepID=A0A9P6ZY67_9AGAM|nr:hypothetical protein EV702DRAFT_1091778 [Suillus placidus]